MGKIFNGSNQAPVFSPIVLVSNQEIKFGSSGTIELRKNSKTGELIESFDILSDKIIISAWEIIIQPTNPFPYETEIYVLMSDGELNEGTTWESLAIAKQLKLGNLTVIIDANGIQSFGHTNMVLNLEPLVDKFKSFGWNTLEVDGHSIPQLLKSLNKNLVDTPKIIIARTTKGKGLKIMENKLEWHYKSPGKIDLDKYIEEVENNA